MLALKNMIMMIINILKLIKPFFKLTNNFLTVFCL